MEDRGVGAGSSRAGGGSEARRVGVAAIANPRAIGTGVNARAGAAACAVTRADGGDPACARAGAAIGGGSGHPASRGLSISEAESSATGPPARVAGSGAAARVSAAWDCVVPALAASGRSVGRLAARSGLTSAPCGLAGTEGTRSAMLMRDVAAPRDHGGACVARTSPKIRVAWRSAEQMNAKPIPLSGRRLSPRLRLKGEYRRDRRNHPPRDSASCRGSLNVENQTWTGAVTDRLAESSGPPQASGSPRS
jgi:hypothetical protein